MEAHCFVEQVAKFVRIMFFVVAIVVCVLKELLDLLTACVSQ